MYIYDQEERYSEPADKLNFWEKVSLIIRRPYTFELEPTLSLKCMAGGGGVHPSFLKGQCHEIFCFCFFS